MNPIRPRTALLLTLAMLAALAVAGSLALYRALAAPPAPSGPAVPVADGSAGYLFRIPRGASAASVAAALEEAGRIRSARAFVILARLSGRDAKLKAGTYRLSAGASVPALLAILSAGKRAEVEVTIPEGLTLRMIADLLERSGVCATDAFRAAASEKQLLDELNIPAPTAEGYLFPDTYRFELDMDPADAVRTMVRAFRTAVGGIPRLAGLSAPALHEKVILASVVEREYRVADEAPLMASVFSNRLKIGMPLQSCATVVYVITEKLGKPHPSTVYYADLQIRDAYNSYLHRGLPPGPISSPGRTSLQAVSDPPPSEYLYFRLLDAESGRHRFSRSLDEHAQPTLSVKGF